MDTDQSRAGSDDTTSANASPSALRLAELDAVLFDFNGTLSDDEGLLMELIIHLARELYGVELDEGYYKTELAGRSDIEIAEALLVVPGSRPGYSADDLLDRLNRRYNDRIAAQHLIRPESPALLTRLATAGVKLAVVTGASRTTVEPALRGAGILGLFNAVITNEDVQAGKPDPEGFQLAAARLNLDDSTRVAAFEDSIPGLQAVRAARMIPIAIVGIHSASELSNLATAIVTDLREDLAELSLPASRATG